MDIATIHPDDRGLEMMMAALIAGAINDISIAAKHRTYKANPWQRQDQNERERNANSAYEFLFPTSSDQREWTEICFHLAGAKLAPIQQFVTKTYGFKR